MSSHHELEGFYQAVAAAKEASFQSGEEQLLVVGDILFYLTPHGVVRIVAEHGTDLEQPLQTMRKILERSR